MAATFDNLEDVVSKFTGTVCVYDNKAVLVKSANYLEDEPHVYTLAINQYGVRNAKTIKLSDPALNYTDFNIGYANQNMFASWWYRRPTRQYRQGLKGDQMGVRLADNNIDPGHFNFNGPFVAMLENSYPSTEECKKFLKDRALYSVAFHRNFALSYDNLHEDFIVEYKGRQVGITPNFKEFKLRDENHYLQQAVREVLV